ncbi:MAG: cbb3-type cytochrome oxidase assembly protein CcoS [Deltaproteobacteria bacterium]|nr:cbb3-type cytochrome oxidase assembly protein CcoS [Deltaproteobacteria bacterium]
MGIIFAILPLSILFAIGGIAAYFWGVRSGQFDDLETPAMRILFDDEEQKDKNDREA